MGTKKIEIKNEIYEKERVYSHCLAHGTDKIEILSAIYDRNKHRLSTFWEKLKFF